MFVATNGNHAAPASIDLDAAVPPPPAANAALGASEIAAGQCTIDEQTQPI